MPLVDRCRHTIHYEALGDAAKPPLLLIMGLALSSRAWDRLPHHLARDFHVLVFDNLGTGKSARRGFAYRMRDLADDAAAVIESAGFASAHVFGISMGGMIAQELAMRHPERVRSLALGAPSPAGAGRSRQRWEPSWIWSCSIWASSPRTRISRVLVSARVAREESGSGAGLDADAPSRRRCGIATAQILAIARHHALARLAQIRAPTLVITGSADARPSGAIQKSWRAASPARASTAAAARAISFRSSGRRRRSGRCASTSSPTRTGRRRRCTPRDRGAFHDDFVAGGLPQQGAAERRLDADPGRGRIRLARA